MSKNGYIYILTNLTNSTLYTGVTSDLARRIYEHKNGLLDGFSKKYNLKKLVYFKIYEDIYLAIEREKQIKKYKRYKKINLVEKENKQWKDLYDNII